MKPLKSAWLVVGTIFSSIGVVALTLSVIFIFTSDILALKLTFGLQGGIWLVVGASFYLAAVQARSKLNRLKSCGAPFQAKIVKIVPNTLIRIGGLSPRIWNVLTSMRTERRAL